MASGRLLRQWASDLWSLIYPRVCEVCGTSLAHSEELMCLQCRADMPLCDFHRQPFNHIHQRLAGHVPIERAAGYFYYYRGSGYTRLIHAAKYGARPRIIRSLAADFSCMISGDGFFDGVDVIEPVPLHISKERARGYNQSRVLAEAIGDVTGLPVGDHLEAGKKHATQTLRGAYSRWLNTRNVYRVTHGEELAGRHVLVVDDVITTGATLLACCEALHRAVPDVTISVLALAVARMD